MTSRAFFLLIILAATAHAAEPPARTVTPLDSLAIDGVPPIPADLPEQVGRYTESRAAGFQDWNPKTSSSATIC